MTSPTTLTERRRAPRIRFDNPLRWKRPGQIEDLPAWAIDRSASGMAFLVRQDDLPNLGARLHVRAQDDKTWNIIDPPMRVTRVSLLGNNFVIVGCHHEPSTDA